MKQKYYLALNAQELRLMGTTTLAVYQAKSQGLLSQSADKR